MAAATLSSPSSKAYRVAFARRGDSLDSLAAEIGKGNAAFARMPLQQKKALLIANNQVLETRPIEPGQPINFAEHPMSPEATRLLRCDSPEMCRSFAGFSPDLQSLLQHTPESAVAMASFASTFQKHGWSPGFDVDDAVTGFGYGLQGADAGAGAASKLLGDVERLGKELAEELFTTFGKKVATSKTPADLARVEQYLKTSRRYQALRKAIERLPDFLKNNLGQLGPTEDVVSANARWLRRHMTFPLTSGTPASHLHRMGGHLSGAVTRFGRIGVATTWVLPAVLGVYNVAQTPPGRRLRVGIEEGVGIGLGALGSAFGVAAGGVLVTALCLTGVGAFIMIALAAGLGGYALAELGKAAVRPTLDFFDVH
jgi:hypothetical protein